MACRDAGCGDAARARAAPAAGPGERTSTTTHETPVAFTSAREVRAWVARRAARPRPMCDDTETHAETTHTFKRVWQP